MSQYIKFFDAGTEDVGTRQRSRLSGRLGLAAAALVVGAGSLVMWVPVPTMEDPLSPIDPLALPDPENPGFDLRGRPIHHRVPEKFEMDPNAPRMSGEESGETGVTANDIRESEKTKAGTKGKESSLGGNQPRAFTEKISPELEARIDALLEKYRAAYEQYLRTRFPEYAKDPEALQKLRDTFEATLEKRIKLYTKVTGTSMADVAARPELIEKMTRQGYYDFVQALKASHDTHQTFGNALKIAGNTHWFEPRIVATLTERYGSTVDGKVIMHAVTSYPSNPDGFIEKYLSEVARLTHKYGDDVNPSVIKTMALSNPLKPDEAIAHYIRTVDALTEKYGEQVDPKVISMAAQYRPRSPEKYVLDYLSAYKRLTSIYGDTVDAGVLKQVALLQKTDQVAFVNAYLQNIERLEDKYFSSYVDEHVIKQAALKHPNPDAFIDHYMREVPRLAAKYPQVDSGVLKYAARVFDDNPDAFIERYIGNLERLTAKYGTAVDQSVIRNAAQFYPNTPDAYVNNFIIELPRLVEKYGSSVGLRDIKEALKNYPTRPDVLLDWWVHAQKELLTIPGVKPSIVRDTLHNNPLMAIEELKKKV